MSKATTQKRPSPKSTVLNRVIWLSFLLVVFVGLFGLATVYLRHESAVLANENKALYAQITEQKRKVSELSAIITRETTRDRLEELIAQHRLQLRVPSETQIVRVSIDPVKRLYDKQSQGLLTVSSF